MIRKAKISDAKEIHTLINHYAEKDLMLPRSMNNIYDNIRDFYVIEIGGKLKGCAALHIIWDDLAEVKALAVDESLKGQGWGRKLVQQCLDEAHELGLKKVFALTLLTDFFHKLGFKTVQKRRLPQKIWGECIHCVKFPDECNEIAVMYEFNGNGHNAAAEK
jgi:amino-acid N-acetyltransferase